MAERRPPTKWVYSALQKEYKAGMGPLEHSELGDESARLIELAVDWYSDSGWMWLAQTDYRGVFYYIGRAKWDGKPNALSVRQAKRRAVEAGYALLKLIGVDDG